MPAVQTLLAQSVPETHASPSAHFGQVPPPQSGAVSVPFWTASEQVGAAQALGEPLHTLLWQSLACVQVSPVPHAVQSRPPQSMAVSLPFCAPSVQLAEEQKPDEQVRLEAQSLWTRQRKPSPQPAQVSPPQSVSVSAPLRTRSSQAGAEHVSVVEEQTPLEQSPATRQP